MATIIPDRAAQMAEAASEFLASLSAEQRARAQYPFTSDERETWYYTPTTQQGLPLLAMDAQQERLALRLVSTGLSRGGYNTAVAIMGLEQALLLRESFSHGRYFGYEGTSRNRDPQMYFTAVFGEPGGAAPWAWHFGGHHVSVNVTVVDGEVVSPTPTFFGSHPAEAPGIGPNTWRPLAGEEDLGRALLHSLDDAQREAAMLAPVAPLDLVLGNRPYTEEGALPLGLWQIFRGGSPFGEERMRTVMAAQREASGLTDAHLAALAYTAAPKGVSAAKFSGAQKAALEALIDQYILRMPGEQAELELKALHATGLDAISFAWAGSDEPRKPHYYRLQGPRFLVEYDNVQDDTNHIHTVWRDPEGDFGRDVLARHYAAAH